MVPLKAFMDLRVYYQKLRKIEAEITEPSVVVVSQRYSGWWDSWGENGCSSTRGGSLDRGGEGGTGDPEAEAAEFRAEVEEM